MRKKIIITSNPEDPTLNDIHFRVTTVQKKVTDDRLNTWLKQHEDAEVEFLNDKWPEEG